MKAFLGMGLLGSNFVKAMLQRGETVQVWNRTSAKATPLQDFGATVCDSPEEAVRGADIVHVTLRDDATVDEVLQLATPGFEPGVIIIDHTTTSAAGAIQRTKHYKQQGFTYVHAPVFMGPQNAFEGTGYMLISSEEEVVQQLEPVLSKMTGKLLNFGNEAGKAAGLKLTGNLFLISLMAGLSDALTLAKAHGIKANEVHQLLNAWNPGTLVPARLQKIIDGNFHEPSWELNMARKDAGLMMQAADEQGTHLSVVATVAQIMDKWIEKGHANDDWSIIAKEAI